MKYCPTCETRFEEDIMRFCTKDGTPLVNEEQPHFVELPSEAIVEIVEDDPGEVTVVRNNIVVPPLPILDDDDSFEPSGRPAERIVVPTRPEPRPEPARHRAQYYPPPRQNTFKVVVLTVIGTLAILGLGAGMFWMLQPERPANNNLNLNLNANANQNVNLGIDTNFNFNTNSMPGSGSNLNTNFNFNAATRTPTPTPTPTPSLSPTPTATFTPRPTPSPTATPDANEVFTPVRPSPTVEGRPRVSPTRTPGAIVRPMPPVNRPD
jgi:hypothetical protein